MEILLDLLPIDVVFVCVIAIRVGRRPLGSETGGLFQTERSFSM